MLRSTRGFNIVLYLHLFDRYTHPTVAGCKKVGWQGPNVFVVNSTLQLSVNGEAIPPEEWECATVPSLMDGIPIPTTKKLDALGARQLYKELQAGLHKTPFMAAVMLGGKGIKWFF